MAQMRISPDVMEIASQEKVRLGLRNEKEAIESMVRRQYRAQHPHQSQQTPVTDPPVTQSP